MRPGRTWGSDARGIWFQPGWWAEFQVMNPSSMRTRISNTNAIIHGLRHWFEAMLSKLSRKSDTTARDSLRWSRVGTR
jgi:hypothetical protein